MLRGALFPGPIVASTLHLLSNHPRALFLSCKDKKKAERIVFARVWRVLYPSFLYHSSHVPGSSQVAVRAFTRTAKSPNPATDL